MTILTLKLSHCGRQTKGGSYNNKLKSEFPSSVYREKSILSQAVKEGIIQKVHLNDLKNRTMTTDRLLGLYITIQQRRATK